MNSRTRFLLATAAGAIALCGLAVVHLSAPWRTKHALEGIADRPSDYWIGAAYSPVSTQRGSRDIPSIEVLEAAAVVKRRLDSDPESPAWTRWQGRVDLLLANHDAAIQELESIRDTKQDRAGILADLGIAYARRADIEERAVDYGRAADALEQSIEADSKDPRPHFNLALVYERLQVLDEAVRFFRSAEAISKDEGWRAEAAKRRITLEGRIARKNARMKARLQMDTPPEDLENLQEQALERWAGGRDAVLSRFAQQMKQRHEDSWWLDAIRAHPAPEAERLLAEAVAKNLAGEDAVALRLAQKARQGLKGPSELRALAEIAYSLQRARRNGECFEAASELERRVRGTGYRWLAVHAIIQKGTCASGLGKTTEGRDLLQSAASLAKESAYRSLELRARGILVEWQAAAGDQSALWRVSRSGLEVYWQTTVRPNRAHQFCYNLAKAAQQIELLYAADSFLRCAAKAAAQTNMRNLEAQARLYHAASSLTVGRLTDMQLEFAEVRGKALPGADSNASRAYAELQQAEAELQIGQPRAALTRLQAMEEHGKPAVESDTFRLRHHQASGLALLQMENTGDAEAKLQGAVELNEKRLLKMSAPDRADAMRNAAPSYRGLVRLQIARHNREAFRSWEWFRAGALRRDDRDWTSAAGHLADETFLAFVVFADGIQIWLSDDRGTQARWTAVRQQEWQPVAKRFLRRCSSPSSNITSLREDGRRLYDWLIAPVASRLDFKRTLIVEPDDLLSGLPLHALVDSQGNYLGDRLPIVVSGGLAELASRSRQPLTRDASSLIVANPKLSEEVQRVFPPLPQADREARFAASVFPNARLLSGADATVRSILDGARGKAIFHFAGHGFINGGNGGLLLADNVLQGGQVSSGNWSSCRLAVLSACSTGTGEMHGPVNPQSLVRAFLLAGAGSVAASLWKVNSNSTSDLMERFYEAIARGRQPSSALQQASLAIRETTTTAHPYYWAAFQLYGAP